MSLPPAQQPSLQSPVPIHTDSLYVSFPLSSVHEGFLVTPCSCPATPALRNSHLGNKVLSYSTFRKLDPLDPTSPQALPNGTTSFSILTYLLASVSLLSGFRASVTCPQ